MCQHLLTADMNTHRGYSNKCRLSVAWRWCGGEPIHEERILKKKKWMWLKTWVSGKSRNWWRADTKCNLMDMRNMESFNRNTEKYVITVLPLSGCSEIFHRDLNKQPYEKESTPSFNKIWWKSSGPPLCLPAAVNVFGYIMFCLFC